MEVGGLNIVAPGLLGQNLATYILEMIYEKINTLVTKELLGRLSGLDEEEPS